MRTALSRFFGFVEVDFASGCWQWQGAKTPKGYGLFDYRRKQVGAHRYSYIAFKGNIPETLTIDHLCRNPSCVNPYHLEAVAMAENIRRGTNRNRMKIHCPYGHPYDARNTSYRNGRRHCRTCDNRSTRAYYSKKRGKVEHD